MKDDAKFKNAEAKKRELCETILKKAERKAKCKKDEEAKGETVEMHGRKRVEMQSCETDETMEKDGKVLRKETVEGGRAVAAGSGRSEEQRREGRDTQMEPAEAGGEQ